MKKKYIWITEIIIWFILIFGSIFSFIIYTKIKDNEQNMYYIFVNDAGGLVQGSPVRLMGINIGYIKEVKIFDNKVFISFLVTQKDTVLPKKTTAIIEFYGLGGSTSLELMQDNSIESRDREIILPLNTYRVKDLWDGQEAVANVMIDIYGGIGRGIKAADLINKKEYFKQSALVKQFAKETDLFNESQTVIINKLSKDKVLFDESNNNIENKETVKNYE